MQQYGGYVPLEKVVKGEFFREQDTSILRLNSGRTAMLCAVGDGGYEKVYVPVYMGGCVLGALQKKGIEIEFYHIDQNFMPLGIGEMHEKEILLWANYYGIIKKSVVEKICSVYKNIIIDNTHAFFSKPQMEAYNVYSCRKFFGVNDGAYLLHRNLKPVNMQKSNQFQIASFLRAKEDAGYEGYEDNEQRITAEGEMEMSDLTRYMLCSIDYEAIKVRRQSNFSILHKELKEINELDIVLEEQVPMIYPLLITDDGIRGYLEKNRIFLYRWWRWFIEKNMGNEFENQLYQYLLPLPIDQRYNDNDMEEIIRIIKKYKARR